MYQKITYSRVVTDASVTMALYIFMDKLKTKLTCFLFPVLNSALLWHGGDHASLRIAQIKNTISEKFRDNTFISFCIPRSAIIIDP
jgi:hypothetical protein